MNIDTSLVGKRLQMLIDEKKITQTNLSKETGISQNAISNYINGNRIPDAKALIKLCKFFSTSIDWLLTGKEATTTNSDILDEYSEMNNELKKKGFTGKDIKDLLNAIEKFYKKNNQ